MGWAPSGSPLFTDRDDGHWRHFDNSVNAISFGFVATAVLISMFLFMAIFEKFLRPTSPDPSPVPSGRRRSRDVESQVSFNGKLRVSSPKAPVNAREVSVLMPGENIPTFIANPAPAPCPPERISWPTHQLKSFPNNSRDCKSNSSSSSV